MKDIKEYLGKKKNINFDPKFDIYESYNFFGHLKQETLHNAKVLFVYLVTIQSSAGTVLIPTASAEQTEAVTATAVPTANEVHPAANRPQTDSQQTKIISLPVQGSVAEGKQTRRQTDPEHRE